MKKRLLALFVSAALCFSLASTAFAAKVIVDSDGNSKVVDDDYKEPDNPPTPPKPDDDDKPDTPTPGPSHDDTTSDDDDDDNGYPISIPFDAKGGKVKVTPNSADKGDTVTITVTPDEGFQLGKLTVTDSKGNKLDVKDLGGGKYSFVMPGSRVKVDATFVRTGSAPAATGFTDVAPGAYYANAVAWAVERGITSGKTATIFAPNEPCTRAQIVTFLWRASGSPAASGENPFTDVPAGAYYHDAVLWAVEKGITSGLTATTFGPNSPCTRGQAVTFLHRMEGKPEASAPASFTDVAADSFCAGAVAWAVEKGVTSGKTATTFAPNETCTRGQIVTFLYRDMV